MRHRWLLVPLACGWATLAAGELCACGDKFLVPSRGTRYSKAPVARREANILVYVNPQARSFTAFGKVPIEAILRDAGYRSTTVADPAELDRALAGGKWDLVLADLADGPALRSKAGDAGSPAIVPVLVEPTSVALAEAKRDYGHALKAPFRSQRLLDAVDGALAARGESVRDAKTAD